MNSKDLESCFNCSKKFKCQDAITGKYDPCDKWTDKKDKPEPPIIA
jgi:hypothetical protein